ncbi:MAG TPA: class GN sortase [Polyangiaceae bacterium]|nr:class GN sortase [Polyangiaceae bacterium]
MRRALSLLLFAVGAVSCLAAGRIYAKAALAQVLLHGAWLEAKAGNVEARPWPWADMWPVARLRSAEHGVDLIVLEGATGSSTAFAPGHIVGTAAPGAAGNVGIAAHRDTHFAFLEQVRVGERLSLELPDGRERAFEVESMQVVNQRDTSSLVATGDRLTLVTCFPFHAPIPGGPLRYVVQARAL